MSSLFFFMFANLKLEKNAPRHPGRAAEQAGGCRLPLAPFYSASFLNDLNLIRPLLLDLTESGSPGNSVHKDAG